MKQPGYVHLLQNSELEKRIKQLFEIFSPCRLCPWKCGVNRAKGERGRCNASHRVKVARAIPHFGEEPAISGSRGSGTIFFSHCNLKCCYCQNYQISHEARGEEISARELSSMMLALQDAGCHNINLVSAAHYLPHIISALFQAAQNGLEIPVVYNTNGYEDVLVLQILTGIVDIYLPDAKYAQDEYATMYSSAENYSMINSRAMLEMFRQTGHLVMDSNGIALRGLIVRHLVLPHGISGTTSVLKNLVKLFGPSVSISLMAQYRPCYKAHKFEKLKSGTAGEDYFRAIETLESLGFENGWIQDWETLDASFIPDFTKADTWN